MKLAFYNPTHPSFSSGPEIWSSQVLPALSARGHAVTLYTTAFQRRGDNTHIVAALDGAGVAVHELPSRPLPGSGSPLPLRVRERPKRTHDVLYSFNGYALQEFAGWALARSTGARWIYGVHAPIYTGYRPHDAYQRHLALRAGRRAIQTHVLNRDDERTLAGLGHRSLLVPYAVADDFFATAADIEARAVASTYRIAFAGRLSEQKRISRLLSVLRQVIAADCDVEVTIIGDGEMRGEVTEFCAETPRSRHLGHLTHDDLARELRSTHAFVSLSAQETFCVALLEAAAAACDVVTTPTSGVATDYAFPFHLVAQDADAATVAGRILERASITRSDDGSYRALVAENRRIARPFTWTMITDAVEDACARAVGVRV